MSREWPGYHPCIIRFLILLMPDWLFASDYSGILDSLVQTNEERGKLPI